MFFVSRFRTLNIRPRSPRRLLLSVRSSPVAATGPRGAAPANARVGIIQKQTRGPTPLNHSTRDARSKNKAEHWGRATEAERHAAVAVITVTVTAEHYILVLFLPCFLDARATKTQYAKETNIAPTAAPAQRLSRRSCFVHLCRAPAAGERGGTSASLISSSRATRTCRWWARSWTQIFAG
jgi:hypothetical protein